MRDTDLECVHSPETLALNARVELGRTLRVGVVSALAAGVIAVAGSIAELSGGGTLGLAVAHALGWVSLVLLFLVLRAYLSLARETSSPGLRTSSQCLFGALVLLQLSDLAMLDVLPAWGRIAVWIVFGIGLLALLTAPFASASAPAETAETPVRTAEEEPATGVVGRAGLLTGLALAALVVLKLAAKGFFAKYLLARFVVWGWLRDYQEGVEAGAVCVVLLLAGVFLVWFGVSKVRLRGQLGGIAVLAGWVEILLVVLCAGGLAWFVAVLCSAFAQPGMTEEALQPILEQAVRTALPVGVAATLVWSLVTAWLFGVARQRLAPAGEGRI